MLNLGRKPIPHMYIDWMTWSIWTLGLALLVYWCIETAREFKTLFSRKRGR